MTLNYTALRNKIPATFAEFKSLYLSGQNAASAYYAELETQLRAANETDEADYASTAGRVTRNEGNDGQFANAYSFVVAEDNGVNFAVGSDAWLSMQYELMNNDIIAREDSNLSNGAISTLDKNDIHQRALEDVGLPPEVYSAYVPTEALAQLNPALADELMRDLIQDDGFGDNFFTNFLAIDVLNGWNGTVTLDYYKWAGNVLETLAKNPSLIAQDFMSDLNDLFGASFVDDLPILGLEDMWLYNLPENAPFKSSTAPTLEGLEGIWNAAKTTFIPTLGYDPLVLDIDGDGLELVSVDSANSIYWDVNEDDFSARSGWVGADDGLLAIDLNANGIIDGQSELFGNETIDGFTALSAYDTNTDNIIDTNDTQFSDLLVWIDANTNGISEAGELYTLANLGITSINLTATSTDYDIAGNNISHEATFTINGQTQTIANALFTNSLMDTAYTGDYTLDVRTLFLPTLRGTGALKDLHIAMSEDETLLTMVAEIATADTNTLFSAAFDVKAKVTDLFYRWADVENVVTDSRGTLIDARKIEFMEAFFGEEWSHSTDGVNVDEAAVAEDLNFLFDRITETISNHILVQTSASTFYGDGSYYDLNTGGLVGTDYNSLFVVGSETDSAAQNNNGLNDVYVVSTDTGTESILDAGGTDTILFAGVTANDIRLEVNGYDLLIYHPNGIITVTNQYKQNITKDYNNYEGYKVETLKLEDGTVIDLLNDVTFEGAETNDSLYGLNTSEVLMGHGGNDTLQSKEGADTLIGGTGDDTLGGGAGNDTYIWSDGDGNDAIIEVGSSGVGGNDTLILNNISANDIRYENKADYLGHNLLLHINNQTITLHQHFDKYQGVYSVNPYDAAYYMIENIELDDGTVIDLTAQYTFEGTSSGETLYGLEYRDDIVYGHAGNDNIYAGGGADTLFGGTGDDYLLGEEGNDVYEWSIGDGDDFIIENGGGDTLLLHGVTESQISTQTAANGNDLEILIGNEKITVIDHERSGSSYDKNELETIKLDDGTVINLLPLATPSGSNVINGTSGNDDLVGTGAQDVLIGGNGNDILRGAQDSDIYHWTVGDGNDWVYEWYGNDDALYLHGVYASDLIFNTTADHRSLIIQIGSESVSVLDHTYGSWSNTNVDHRQLEKIVFDDGSELDLLGALTSYGSSSNSLIYGRRGEDIFYGGSGDETFIGYYGNDTLAGGLGNDTLNGGEHDDTYHWSVGDGNDLIQEWTGTDVLYLHNVNESDIRYEISDNQEDLIIHVGSNESVTIFKGMLSDLNGTSTEDRRQVETMQLDDGTVIDLTSITTYTGDNTAEVINASALDDTVYGLDGNDTLNGRDGGDILYGGNGNDKLDGYYGNDHLYGGAGDDTLWGGGGDDFYHWSVGDGSDLINEWYGNDILELHGVTQNDIRLEKTSDHYSLNIIIGSEAIHLLDQLKSDWLNSSAYDKELVETLRLDDGTIISLNSGLTYKGTSAGENVLADRGNNTVYGEAGNDELRGYDGDDHLYGGAGDDVIHGGLDSDTYHWSVGDGNDTIFEWYGTNDTLHLHGVTMSQVTFESTGSSYDLLVKVGNETIFVADHYQSDWNNTASYDDNIVESLKLDDGTVISLTNDMVYTGSTANDYVYGINANDETHGLEGNDFLYGYSGNDELYGGDGADKLYGGAGNDKLYGGDGLDELYGQGGADDFIFEAISAFNNIDQIKDFNTSQGDRLDLSDLIQGFDSMTHAISDFVQITTVGSDSHVAVDTDGGADNFVQVATIESVTGLTDEDQLYANGTLLV